MRIFFALVMALSAFAHGAHDHNHDAEDSAEQFDQFVKQNFFLKTSGASPMGESYVRMPDGGKFALDSQFWSAAASLADAMGEAVPGPEVEQKKFSLPFINGLNELRKKHFWLELSVTGGEFFVRYGPLTLVMIVTAELVEHSIIPGPAMCAVLQASCVLWGKQVQEIWSSVRFRNPQNRSLPIRMATSLSSTYGRLQYWRSLRLIFRDKPDRVTLSKKAFKKYYFDRNSPGDALLISSPFWAALGREREVASCTHDHGFGFKCSGTSSFKAEAVYQPAEDLFESPLRADWSVSQRFFAAEEQMAFLELQMSLAKSATESLSGQSFWLFWKLRMALAKEGAALDKYGFLLRKLASANLTSEAREKYGNLVHNMIEQYQDYLVGVNQYIKSVQAGQVPFRNELSDLVFKSPRRMLKEITRLLQGRCEDLLQRAT